MRSIVAALVAVSVSAFDVDKLSALSGKQGIPNTDYKYGNSCATKSDDDCALVSCPDVAHCRWSWASDDSPSGTTAKCRCDMEPIPDPADYDFGDACKTKSDDDCGIMKCPSVDHCRFSWAKTDPDKWNGKTAHCRCDEKVDVYAIPFAEPLPVDPFVPFVSDDDYKYGNSCATKSDDDCALVDCPDVAHCRWSWLSSDSPSGTSAKCRCDMAPIPDPKDYDFGDACGTAFTDHCEVMKCPSVDHCRWSWAKTDPRKDKGKTAHCRCDELGSGF